MNQATPRYLTFPNGSIWPVCDQTVSAVIGLDLAAASDGLESFLDAMSETATGSALLNNLSYEIVGFTGTTMKLSVNGEIDLIVETHGEDDGTSGQDRANYTDAQDRESYTLDEDNPSLPEATFEQFALQQGWLDCEIKHAKHAGDVDYGDETVIRLASGREIRCPVFPANADYVRVTCLGFELAYWTSDELQFAPAEVLGAFLGAAHAKDA